MPHDIPIAIIYTDGACLGNPGPGGWAYRITQNDQILREAAGQGGLDSTNNAMELQAVVSGLRWLFSNRAPEKGFEVRVVSDSQYVVMGANQWVHGWVARGWRKQDGTPVLNRELWEELHVLITGRPVSFHWVKGHAGNPHNEAVDYAASRAAKIAAGQSVEPYPMPALSRVGTRITQLREAFQEFARVHPEQAELVLGFSRTLEAWRGMIRITVDTTRDIEAFGEKLKEVSK